MGYRLERDWPRMAFLPEFVRRAAHGLFEMPVEIGEIFVAAAKGDFRDGLSGGGESRAGGVDAQVVQVLDGTDSCSLFKAAHEIAFAQVGETGKIFYGNVFPIMPGHIFQSRTDGFSIVRFLFFLGAQEAFVRF